VLNPSHCHPLFGLAEPFHWVRVEGLNSEWVNFPSGELESMQILGISGSPREGGNTEIIINEALNVAQKEGAKTEFMRLSDYHLEPCVACGVCFKTKNCTIKDDHETIYQKIVNTDGLILGSPSYFQGVTAQMKTFIDRIGYLCLARGRTDFEGKVGGVIAVARRSGLSGTSNQMMMFLAATRIVIPRGEEFSRLVERKAMS